MANDFHSALITGGTGFIGQNLAHRLAAPGCSVHVLVRPESDRSLFAEQQNIFCQTYDGTVDSMIEAVTESKPDVVFHLATRYHAHHTPDQLGEMIQANITLGIHMLEAMAVAKVNLLINAGSAWQSYRDQDYCPVNLYAAMKQALEDLIVFYVDVHGLRAITLRIFDTYGPNDPRRKLIPLLIKTLRDGSPLDMSTGEQKLDLLHIEDVLNAFLQAASFARETTRAHHDVFSLASGERHTVKEIVALLAKLSDTEMKVSWGAVPNRERDVFEPWTKGKQLPGWSPTVSLEDGLRCLLDLNE